MFEWAAQASDIVRAVCFALGAFGGLWAAYHRLRLLLRTEIRDLAATKEDLARVETKVDVLLSVIVGGADHVRKSS